MGAKHSLMDDLVNFKMTSKQMNASARKCEKNQATQKAKLKKAIGGLERQGLVGKFESRLAEDPSSLEAMVCAHEEYARLRWESLGEDERALAEQRSPRIVSSLRDTGVAGIDWRRTGGSDIKCLHTHYAHFRGGGTKNVVGKWVHELIVDEQPEIL